MRASTRVSALGPFVSKPYDSRYSTRKSCPTQRKDGKSRKRICLSRYDWSAWMLSWLGEPSKSFKLWFQHNLKSHKTKLSYANAKQPRCLSNPFYWTNYDMDQRLTGFLISKSIELQWAICLVIQCCYLSLQLCWNLGVWNLELWRFDKYHQISNFQHFRPHANICKKPETRGVWDKSHYQNTWKWLSESASLMWTAASPSADF